MVSRPWARRPPPLPISSPATAICR
jgi:hypothetical protein